ADADYAPALWGEAESKSGEADAAFTREAYAEAAQGFDAAAALYQRFQDATREAQRQERDVAQLEREQAADGRQRSQAEDAAHYARDLWDAAEAKSVEAQAAFADKAMARATSLFTEARVLYGRAEEA